MYFIERHMISPRHPLYTEVDKLCFLSKNLYNAANYIVRQEFIKTIKEKEAGLLEHAIYLNYQEVRRRMLKDENYVALPRKVSNHVLMVLHQNWLGFFASIKSWKVNPDKYTGRPKLPQYKHKTEGRFGLEYELGAISKKALKRGVIGLSKTGIEVPFINQKAGNLISARIVVLPTLYYKIEIIYKKQEEELKENNNFYIGTDLGVNNLAALTSNNKKFKPIVVNGRPIKSINQFYNKMLAKYQSELPEGVYISRKIRRLTQKRDAKIEQYFHKASSFMVNKSLQYGINTIVIGKNPLWKQEANMGIKNNQSFVEIPFNKFIAQISYKAKFLGINVLVDEESYTSKASFLNLDPVPVYDPNNKNEQKFSGYRESRGLYKIKGKKIRVNADTNGSYNIIRKVAPNAFADGVEGFAVIPEKVTFSFR